MKTTDLLEILKSKAANGTGILKIEKTKSNKDRVIISIKFDIGAFWSNGFVLHDWDKTHILNILNNKFCESIIL